MGKLEGQVALVTGSGRGIGRAIAHKLAREGAQLVINDLDPDTGNAVAAEIKNAGGAAFAFNGNVCDAHFADQFIGAALREFGGIDIIVNNAGYAWDAAVHKTTDEQMGAMFDVHVMSPLRILRAAAGPIRQKAGEEAEAGIERFRKVVNISSIAGLGGNAGQAAYSSAKAAVVGLTRTLSKEWGRYKVNVNCVAFGLIDTRLTRSIESGATTCIAGRGISAGIPSGTRASLIEQIPLKRSGTPAEAADAVYLVCIPESNYISGQVIVCSGGLML